MTLPLAGIKVLEFSEHGFVPSAVAVLAEVPDGRAVFERLVACASQAEHRAADLSR
jgi:hypothetical protein